MKKAAIILAEGFEEVEALAPFDILKRGGVEASLVGLDGLRVSGAHGAILEASALLGEYDFGSCDMVILPGGLPGATNLASSEALRSILVAQNEAGKYCAAICAAPLVLARAGLIKGSYTCYPGFENNVSKNAPKDEKVVFEGNVITSRGPGTAFDFGLALLELLEGKTKRDEVAKGMLLA